MSDATDGDPANALYRERPELISNEVGSGPELVFNHGTMMDWTMFEPQQEHLSGEYRTIAYNSRARTERWRGPYDLWDEVEDCRNLLNGKDIDDCVLAGMSKGGFMALRFALRYPERLNGLILIDSRAKEHTEEEKEEYTQLLEAVEGEERLPENFIETVPYLFFGEETLLNDSDLVERWKRRWQTYPGDAVFHEANAILDMDDLVDRLGEIEIPTLIIHGEKDNAIDLETAEQMKRGINDARLVTIPEAGHTSNLEQPAVVNEAIEEFLIDTVG